MKTKKNYPLKTGTAITAHFALLAAAASLAKIVRRPSIAGNASKGGRERNDK